MYVCVSVNMKEGKKMRRLVMCQSHDATTSCMIRSSRRSSDHRHHQTLVELERTRLLSNTKYIRLGERRGYHAHVPAESSWRSSSTASNSCVKLDQTALPLSSSNQLFQVVVMRVSIHCQGCAGKVKKHLSKMKGVTSFNIDLETKRVTVMGHVSPMAVLESMSKVKKAELWPPNLLPV